MDVDESGADAPDVAEMSDVPPPPVPVAGPSERRRARVQLPEQHEDEGPTYYRLGVDYPVDPEDGCCFAVVVVAVVVVVVVRLHIFALWRVPGGCQEGLVL